MNKRQAYILTGVLLLVGGITYAQINRSRKKKMIKEIYDALEKETGSTGTYEDLENSDAFDPNFWKVVQEKNIKTKYLLADAAKSMAKQINKAMDVSWYTDEDEDAVYAVFKRVRNLVQVSQISYYYNTQYKKNLYDFLNDKMSTSEMEKIENILKTKPRY